MCAPSQVELRMFAIDQAIKITAGASSGPVEVITAAEQILNFLNTPTVIEVKHQVQLA